MPVDAHDPKSKVMEGRWKARHALEPCQTGDSCLGRVALWGPSCAGTSRQNMLRIPACCHVSGLARVQHKTKAMRVCCQSHVQGCGADGVGAFQEAAAAAHR